MNPEPKNTVIERDAATVVAAARSPVFLGSGFDLRSPRNDLEMGEVPSAHLVMGDRRSKMLCLRG
jgi:hypothetical protein